MSGKAKKTKGKMQQAVLSRTLLPMIIMGVIIVIAVLVGYRTTIKEEECKNLKIVAYSISSAFDEMYPGEYKLVGDRLLSFYKGDVGYCCAVHPSPVYRPYKRFARQANELCGDMRGYR